MKHYRSSIPKAARERVVETFETNGRKRKAEYRLNRKLVGIRYFYETGELEAEIPMQDGRQHGTFYDLSPEGVVLSAQPYRNGLEHGTTKQWSNEGKLIGTYTMRRGTGLDLWRCQYGSDGEPFLVEARYVKDGNWHGFEWWIREDQKSVSGEHHFWDNNQHGIQRAWNYAGKLRRGYPKYWIKNIQVTKRQYVEACATDPTLPSFNIADNLPQRRFPPEVREAMIGSPQSK
jgi:antitoxin component YwqK of YwqJK toxin-antitoxin module